MIYIRWGLSGVITCFLMFFPSRGALGGSLIIWDLDFISQKKIHIFEYFIEIEVVWLTTGLEVLFISVYAPQGQIARDNYGIMFFS